MPIKRQLLPKWTAIFLPLLLVVAIFWLSIIKAPKLHDAGNWFWDNIDKPGHLIAYATLTASMLWAYRRIILPQKGSMIIVLMCLAFVYSLFLEIVQHFLPYRTFDPWDLLANAIGITLAAIFFSRFKN
jgi:VanZ family protein